MIKLVAEFLGAFALLSSIFFVGSWYVIGATLALVIYAIGDISGAHVNPAVSFAFWLKGGLSTGEFFSYAVVQMLGAAAALYAYKALA